MICSRKTILGGFAATVPLLLLGSAAYACTSIYGQMTLTGGGGQSVAVGGEGSHEYCHVTGGAKGSGGSTIKIDLTTYTAPVGTETLPYELGDNCFTTGFAPSGDAPGGPRWVRNPTCFSPVDGTPLPVCAGPYHTWQGQGYGPYEVRFMSNGVFNVSGTTYSHTLGGNNNCITLSGVVLAGGLTVGADGNGTWTGKLPTGKLSATAPTDAGAVCVRNTRDSAIPPPDPNTAKYDNYYGADQPLTYTNQAPIAII